jgi:hypothetical protein
MAEGTFVTLAEWAARRAPNGGIAQVANVLAQLNPVLQDIPWVEGNLPTGHRITQAANALPSASWRRLNQGVAEVTATVEQFDETCGMLETESKIDVDLAKLNGDAAAFRMSEDQLIMEGISQQFATAAFYESVSTNPERIHGLAPRYYSTTAGDASAYTLKGTNAGVNAQSLWLINWAPRKIYGIYPKGSAAGLVVEDKGEQRVLDSSDNPFYAYVTRLQWKCGIAVEDYRFATRFQWDPDDSAFADDDRGMILALQQMIGTIHTLEGSPRFYMSRTSKRKLDAQLASNDVNLLSQWQNGQGGKMVQAFSGIPLRICDALVAETAI